MKGIKAVIFDVMGVILDVDDDIGELLIPFITERNRSITGPEIERAFHEGSLGELSSRGFWEKVGLGADGEGLDQEYLQGRFPLDKEFMPLISGLKKDYRIALLSNDIAEWNVFLMDHYSISPLVDVSVISGKEGVRKPDHKIFNITLERLGLSASECVYIDDRPGNVDAARELGFQAFLFNRTGIEYSGEQITALSQVQEILKV